MTGRLQLGSTSDVDATSEVVLRPAVHATTVGADLVLLDIGADAYFCVRAEPAEVVEVVAEGRRLRLSRTLADALAAGGMLGRDAAPALDLPLRSAPPPATRTLLCDRYGRPQWSDLTEAIPALWAVLRGYHRRSFAKVISSRAPIGRTMRPADAAAIVDRFHRWVPYAPVSGKCLLRAFMLRHLLRRAGHDPAWVFGVQTWPFAAHCWLQMDDIVLDDHPDRVASYTPILVV